MSEWKTYKLGELPILFIDGDRGKNYPKGDDFSEVGHCLFLNAGNVTKNGWNFDGNVYISEEKDNLLRNGKLERGDIVLTTRGTVGNVVLYSDDIPYKHIRINSGMVIIRNNNTCYNPYLYQYLRSYSFLKQVQQFQSGSAQPQIPISTLKKLTISLPPLAEQKRIADILSAIDDKIELNRRINANLEQQAQALYKSWFVDFEFPNEEGKPYKSSGGKMQESELGLIPNYWHVGKLSDIADITMGQSPVGTSYNDCGNGVVFYQGRTEFGFRFPSIKLFTTAPTRYAEPMSVLLSVRAPVGDINIAAHKCCIGRGLASIKSKNNHNSFMYYCLNALKIQLEQYNGEGTVFGSINKKELENLRMSIPNDLIVANFNRIINRIDTQILNLSNEINNLSTLRDTLLPKLMSGEIKV